jgi:PAS domain S-box-containing protein
MTQALLNKEIDVIVAWMSYDHWRKEKLQGTIDNIFLIDEYPIEMVTYIRKDWPELIPVLNKAIAALQQDELPRIINKWFGQWPRASKAYSVILTPEEQAWLNEHTIVRIRFRRQPPYMYLEDGKTAGMTADLLNKISEMVDITFEIEKTPSKWSDDLGRLIRHEDVDMLPSIMATPERESVILFTESYVTSPRFIFTRDNAPFISSIKELSGKSIAVVENYAVHIELVEKHPSVDLLVFNNVEESLRAVSSGKAFAFIGDLFYTPALINKLGLKNLKAACPSGLSDHHLTMGVRNDWPELRDILDKALDAMSAAEKTAIINKWATVKFEHGIRPADVLKWILMVVGVASGILFLFMFWNRSLSKQVKERTDELGRSNESLETEISERMNAEDEIRRSRDYLNNLTNSMGDVVFLIKMPERKIEWANDSSFYILGYDPEELIGRTTEFLYPDKNEFLAFGDKLSNAVAEGKDIVYLEQFLRRKSGEAFPVEITVTIHQEKGKVVSATGIIRDITERKQTEQTLQAYQQRLKALAFQLTIAEEKERRAIAADLHDHVGQSLALARIQLTSARQFASESKLAEMLDEISDSLLKTLEDTQLLMLELSSPAMHEIGLSSAISGWLESQIGNRHSLKAEVIDNIPDSRRKTLDSNVRTILFRNVRELLVNVVKHARANKVSVRLEDRSSSIRIIVEDDGIGFEPRAMIQADSKIGGFGLFSIEELMADLGGNLKIVSEPGKGCTAILSAPFGVAVNQERD